MLVALRLLEGPTVLSLACVPMPGSDSPEVCAIHQAMDCVLDADMHVSVETSWGRAVFTLREDDAPWLGLYPSVSIHRYTQRGRPVLSCTMGPMARHAVLNCLHVLHPKAWELGGGNGDDGAWGSPVVLSVAVVVEHKHDIWHGSK